MLNIFRKRRSPAAAPVSMPPVDERRVALWRALSELFLDTEPDTLTFDYVARVVLESGYRPEQVRQVLWAELYPVLAANLASVAGEWAGWSDAWLLEHIRPASEPARHGGHGSTAREIRRCWTEIAARLPADFS